MIYGVRILQRKMSVMKKLKQKLWRDECGKILSNSKGSKKNRSLQRSKLQRSKKPKQTTDQARRKKMARAQDGILKYMLKLMEVCKARGFVYGIIPEKGKACKWCI
ncbi:hypothetical protein OIU84_003385 [Salix udensis]|uniref:Ethylene insensitive 3-like DNA-binding domain-containing protein n=1 Tax=Salix udensis TaxID=889485 RepID=A0AAD6K056_9ROSI|nr:hypothetical protein OIU84_003385 [Salix udensis]